MTAQASWVGKAPPVKHNISIKLEDPALAEVGLYTDQRYGSGLPRIVGNSADLRRVLDALHSGDIGNGLKQFVGLQVDHIEQSRPQMRRKQILVLIVDRQVIKTLTGWARKIDYRDLFQSRGTSERP